MLGELGATYELAVVTQAEQASAAHRRRHPLARVPVLDDGEGLVFESAAICLHLADLYAEARLLPPAGSHERALVYQWAFFAMTELEAPLATSPTAPRPATAAAATCAIPSRARSRSRPPRRVSAPPPVSSKTQLGDGDYLVAERFGVADLLIGSVLAWADDVGLLAHNHPKLTKYLTALRARPAYAY